MKQRGFTLIEILITVFVIALFVGLVGLSFQNDPRYKEIEREGKRLKFYLEMASDEAIFQNVDLGFYLTKSGVHPYKYKFVEPDPNNPEDEGKYVWEEFQTRLLKAHQLPELFEFDVSIDGQNLKLNYSVPEKIEEIEPQFFISASGEQPVAEFELSIEEFTSFAIIKGEGLGRFVVEVIHEDI